MNAETSVSIQIIDEYGTERELVLNVKAEFDPGRPARYTMPPSKGVPEPPSITDLEVKFEESGESVPWAIEELFQERIEDAAWDALDEKVRSH